MNVISHCNSITLLIFQSHSEGEVFGFSVFVQITYVQKDEEIFSFSFVVLVLARKQNPHLNSVDFSRCSVTNKKADEEDG